MTIKTKICKVRSERNVPYLDDGILPAKSFPDIHITVTMNVIDAL